MIICHCGGPESASGTQEIREIFTTVVQSVPTCATGNTLILPVVTLVTPNMNTHGYTLNLNPFLVDDDDDDSVSSACSFFSIRVECGLLFLNGQNRSTNQRSGMILEVQYRRFSARARGAHRRMRIKVFILKKFHGA